jgi:hypothetical protein
MNKKYMRFFVEKDNQVPHYSFTFDNGDDTTSNDAYKNLLEWKKDHPNGKVDVVWLDGAKLTPLSVIDQFAVMETIISANLPDACEDVQVLHVLGVLPPKSILKLAAMQLTNEVFLGTQMVHVENCVNRLAIRYVINSLQKI